MICYVDASFRDNKSYHAFTIKDWNGRILFEKKFRGFETKSTEAELGTMIKALQFIREKGFKKVRILTDCLSIVEGVRNGGHENIDVSYLKFLLRETNSTIKWIPRKANKRCDSLCRNVYKRKIKRGLLIK